MHVVSNASPLIILAKANLINLLPDLYCQIEIPHSVFIEIINGPQDDPIKKILPGLNWLKEVVIDPPLTPLASWQLGPGESEVIEWARLNRPSIALLDDRLARKRAEALGIKVKGTLGIIATAYKKNLIPSFIEAVEKLKKANLYINQDIIDSVIDYVENNNQD